MPELDQAALQCLLDERELRKLYLRYARGVDRLDAELLRSCFHEDAQITTSSTEIRDDFVRNVMVGLSRFKMTQHVTTNIWVEVDGDTACGEAYAQANHRAPGEDGEPDTDYRWGGRYVDHFDKRNGEWRFSSRVVLHDMDRVVKVDETWDPPGLGFTEGIHSTADLVYQE
jgi:hypothetical protein